MYLLTPQQILQIKFSPLWPLSFPRPSPYKQPLIWVRWATVWPFGFHGSKLGLKWKPWGSWSTQIAQFWTPHMGYGPGSNSSWRSLLLLNETNSAPPLLIRAHSQLPLGSPLWCSILTSTHPALPPELALKPQPLFS